MKMKIKILKQFGAAMLAVCIVYGAIATTYRSYQNVQAAQVEIPEAVVVKETSDTSQMMMTNPVTMTTTVTPAVTTATTASTGTTASQSTAVTTVASTTTVTASTADSASTATTSTTVPTVEPATTTKQEDIVPAVDNSASTQTTIETQPAPTVPTLSEFLSQLRCGGCGRNCSLLNPRCGTGASKAQQAESEYYATYN